MEVEAIEFLLIVDAVGTIERTAWCQLPTAMADACIEGGSILELFPQECRENILPYLRQALADGQALSLAQTVLCPSGSDLPAPLSLVFIPFTEDRVLLLGVGEQRDRLDRLTLVYSDLVNTMRQEFKNAFSGRETSIQQNFEEIQHLNNELVNMSRKLEKARYQLQIANQGLKDDVKRDKLTGLVGQYQFWGDMERLVRADPNQYAVFVFLDLDDFKYINDHFGHVSGDKVLVEFARRLKAGPWPDALRIRLSGDEFGLFFPQVKNPDQDFFASLGQQIRQSLTEQPIQLETVAISIKLSGGAAIYGRHTKDLNDLIRYADHAMYQAKNSGKDDFVVFDPAEFERQQKPPEYVELLETILHEQDLYHSFQPIVSLDTVRVMGFYGFLRSHHPVFADPRVLLATALQSGQNYFLERTSLQRLFLSWNRSQERQLGDRRIFIPQGPYPGFQAHAIERLSEKLPEQGLVVEVPVSADVNWVEYQTFVDKLRSWKCGIALKYFGTGGGPELRLLTMQPEFVKLSAAVFPKAENTEEWLYLERMVQLAKSQGSQVIIEDIETQEQIEQAVSLQPDYLQGFYIAYPGELTVELAPETVAEIVRLRASQVKL